MHGGTGVTIACPGRGAVRRVGKGALRAVPTFLPEDAGGHAALCPPLQRYVVASEAKQSMGPLRAVDCFVACAPRNDGRSVSTSETAQSSRQTSHAASAIAGPA